MFIELTLMSDDKFLVNISAIERVIVGEEGVAAIVWVCPESSLTEVKESYREVVDEIVAATQAPVMAAA